MSVFFASVIIALAAAVAADVLTVRMARNRVLGYISSFVVTLVATPGLVVFLSDKVDIYFIVITSGVALLWWFVYLNIAQAIESSLRIRLLFEIRRQGNSIPINNLCLIYNDTLLIDIRIKRMEENKALLFDGRGWRLNSQKLRNMASLFTFLKKIMLNRTNQFHS